MLMLRCGSSLLAAAWGNMEGGTMILLFALEQVDSVLDTLASAQVVAAVAG
jgi:hypothetical protein